MDFGNPDAGLSGSELAMPCATCGERYEDHNDETLGHLFDEPQEDYPDVND